MARIRYNKYKDKELNIMKDNILYKFEYNYKSHKKMKNLFLIIKMKIMIG